MHCQIYELLVVDTKPNKAVSIIECDMKVCIILCLTIGKLWLDVQVDFAPPVGYKHPDPTRPRETEEPDTPEEVSHTTWCCFAIHVCCRTKEMLL